MSEQVLECALYKGDMKNILKPKSKNGLFRNYHGIWQTHSLHQNVLSLVDSAHGNLQSILRLEMQGILSHV